MKTIMITVIFDNDNDLALEDRDFDRFIIQLKEDELLKSKLLKVFELKNYSWDNREQYEKGYKAIMQIQQDNLTDLEVY